MRLILNNGRRVARVELERMGQMRPDEMFGIETAVAPRIILYGVANVFLSPHGRRREIQFVSFSRMDVARGETGWISSGDAALILELGTDGSVYCRAIPAVYSEVSLVDDALIEFGTAPPSDELPARSFSIGRNRTGRRRKLAI